MKKLLALVVLITIGNVVFATGIDDPKSPVGIAVTKSGSIIKLFYKNKKACNVMVSIYNEQGDKLFSETIRKVGSFVRPYNFSPLNEGEYTIEIKDDDGVQKEKVHYTTVHAEKLANLLPVKAENNKVLLTVSNKGKDQLMIKIYSESNDLLYQQLENITDDFAKVYNLSNVTGKVTFVVSDRQGVSKRLSL